jgi:hypothetical protein
MTSPSTFAIFQILQIIIPSPFDPPIGFYFMCLMLISKLLPHLWHQPDSGSVHCLGVVPIQCKPPEGGKNLPDLWSRGQCQQIVVGWGRTDDSLICKSRSFISQDRSICDLQVNTGKLDIGSNQV